MREAIVALGYFALYLVYLFFRLESERLHWISLVVVPLVIVAVMQRSPRVRARDLFASFGISRARMWNGLWWAALLGLSLCALQLWASREGRAMAGFLVSRRALTVVPVALGLSIVTAGLTEEFFFRGFVQSRLNIALGRAWVAILITSILFGAYHLPYAYLNPRWPSHGHWSAAAAAAFGQGVPGGLILGAVFHKSRGNLFAAVIVHALVNLFPITLMLAHMNSR